MTKEEIKAYKKKWQQDNYGKLKPYLKDWAKLNAEKVKAYKRTYATTHAGQVNAITAKRRAVKLRATPKWLTKDQLKEIREFYILAKELQWLGNPTDPLEVDHIVPLQGENVSGLHVPWNLQILSKSLNGSKSNKHE